MKDLKEILLSLIQGFKTDFAKPKSRILKPIFLSLIPGFKTRPNTS